MSLLDFLFPRRCFGCNTLGEYFCSDCCLKELVIPEPICPHCGYRSVFGQVHSGCRQKYGLDGLMTFFKYRGLVQKALKELKYRGVTDQVEELVQICVAAHSNGNGEIYPRLDESWILVPVPLYSRRLRQRGFNQTALIGEVLAKKLSWRFTDVLIRVKKTKPQSDLKSKQERHQNIQGAFGVKNGVRLRNKKIILLDDIWTSGSTLKECARVLKRKGVAKVWGLVLAR